MKGATKINWINTDSLFWSNFSKINVWKVRFTLTPGFTEQTFFLDPPHVKLRLAIALVCVGDQPLKISTIYISAGAWQKNLREILSFGWILVIDFYQG